MRSTLNKVRNVLNTRAGFFALVFLIFWIKTYVVYVTKFSLGITGPIQKFLLIVNPLPFGLLLFGIALYFKGKKSYWIMMIVDLIESLWLFSNVLYYREFSDFLSMGIIKSSGSVSNNLTLSIGEILHASDLLIFADVIVLALLLATKVIKVDSRTMKMRYPIAITIISALLFVGNLGLADKDRPQLLTRTFDNNYIVKYLGMNFYAGYNAYQTHKESATRASASSSDMDGVLKFLKNNRSVANPEYFGKAAGKNVFIFHLESFQQFLINYKVNGKEVTPNINKFYADQNTLSFDNFYNQVGQGKTSDAETMLENSLFGLPSGSVMTSYGTSNTFQAMPAILDQQNYILSW